jgi:tetratricopeptide (TPR) repeat protein
MDRAARILLRLMWPLGVLVLAAGAWLLAPPGRLSCGSDARPVRTSSPHNAPAENTLPGEPAEPELFRRWDLTCPLPPLSEQFRLVLASGFPREGGAKRWGEESRAESVNLAIREKSGATGGPPTTSGAAAGGQPVDIPVPASDPRPPQCDAGGAPGDATPASPTTAPSPGPAILPQLEASPLVPRDESIRRSEQLENIARQADRQIRHGFELAGRQACFAARSEFVTALRLVAQGLDAEQQTTVHSRSLAAGLTAIKEAEDFIPSGSRVEADLDLARIIGSHRTPVLKDAAPDAFTPLLALKCYFTFAQEQLAAAAGHEVAGSIALHALGKLHGALAGNKSANLRAAEPKAMACYQAALLVCPQNYMAANDLGVLLARCGNYPDARAVLEHSLSIQQPSTGWHNLAVVYQRFGEFELARRTGWQAEMARRAEQARAAAMENPANQFVRWVDPETFARSNFEAPAAAQPLPAEAKTPQTSAQQPSPAAKPRVAQKPAPAARPAATGWLPQ